jgi:hypothetical protein
MAFTDSLWGGQLTAIQLDPTSHECQLRIRTLIKGAEAQQVLLCRGVTELRFYNGTQGPWTYAEVTEAHASHDLRTDTWLLELMLWSEDAGLTLRCVKIQVAQA